MSIFTTRLPAFAKCAGKPGDQPCAWTEFQADETAKALNDLKVAAQDHADTTGHETILWLGTRLHFLPAQVRQEAPL